MRRVAHEMLHVLQPRAAVEGEGYKHVRGTTRMECTCGTMRSGGAAAAVVVAVVAAAVFVDVRTQMKAPALGP